MVWGSYNSIQRRDKALDNEPDSPCNGTCTLNRQNVCEGCFRTIHEVVRWGQAKESEKQAILARAKEREKQTVPGLALVG